MQPVTIRRMGLTWCAILFLALATSGCTSETPSAAKSAAAEPSPIEAKAKTDQQNDEAAGEEPPEVLLEPFDPPPLAELDAEAEWIDRDVLDSLELLRERQANETPLVSVAEALRLRNDSKENNLKILSALGRLPSSESEVDWDASIVRHSSADIKSTNPLMGSSVVEFEVSDLTSFGLFGFDWNFRMFASRDSVVSWQTSKDRLLDKVVLRDDLTWSDGKPITAYDVEFSFKTIMNPKIPVPAVRSGTDKLRWVEAYDDRTVVFFHKDSLATNHWNITFPIIPKHIYEKSIEEDFTLQNSPYHVKYEDQPISGGPYKVTRRDRGQGISLVRREDYYMYDGKQVRDKPYIREVQFRVIEDPNVTLLAIKKGDIDECMLTAEQWKAQTDGSDFYEKNTKATATEWVSFHFCWNVKSKYFSDLRTRRAMSYAFDHDEMLNSLFYGLYEPSTGTFHRTSWMHPKDPPAPYKQNLDKAEELLDEAGWEDSDGDGIRDKMFDGKKVDFKFTILCSQTPNSIKVCTLLKESLDQIGVICNVKPTEFTVLQQLMRDHKFSAAFGGWGTGTDPDSSVNVFGSGEMRNYGQYSNPKIDELFKQGSREFDQKKRAEIYGRIHEVLYEDQPYTWLFYRNAFYAFGKKLRGYNFSPRGPYNYGPGFMSIWIPLDQK